METSKYKHSRGVFSCIFPCRLVILQCWGQSPPRTRRVLHTRPLGMLIEQCNLQGWKTESEAEKVDLDEKWKVYILLTLRLVEITRRRKFRSETSDNMDSWKSRGGKSQNWEEKKWEDQRRKKIQVREKVGKSRFTVFSNDLWLRRVEK